MSAYENYFKKKPKLKPFNIWQEIINQFPSRSQEIKDLKAFLMAPDDGFLLVNILHRFTELNKNIKTGIPDFNPLLKFIKTAIFVKHYLTANYSPSQKDYFQFYLDAYLSELYLLNGLNQTNVPHLVLEDFLHRSLWHNYMKENAVYVCLFFPYVAPSLQPNASLQVAIRVHAFIKQQALKLLASQSANLVDSIKYGLSYGLIKIIYSNRYKHLIIVGFELMDSPKLIVENLNKNSANKEDSSIEDKTDLTTKLIDEELENKVNRARNHLTAFFRRFYTVSNSSNDTSRGEDKSERAKYNRMMGLVLTGNDTARYLINRLDLDETLDDVDSVDVFKLLPEPNDDNEKLDLLPGSIVDDGDDLIDEVQSEQLFFPKVSPCELKNPIASIINGKSILPHISYANQQLKSRTLPHSTKHLIQLISLYSKILARNIKAANTDAARSYLAVFLLLLFGRTFEKIELDDGMTLSSKTLWMDIKTGRVKLHFDQYENAYHLATAKLYEDSSIDTVELQLTENELAILLPMIEKASSGVNHIAFPTKNKEVNRFLKEFKLGIDLGQLKQSVQRSYSDLTSGDYWLMNVFCGLQSGLQNTQKHYASAHPRKTQRIFEKHCEYFLGFTVVTYAGFNRLQTRIGSPYFVRQETMQSLLELLGRMLSPLFINVPFNHLSFLELCCRFNAFAIYIDQFCAFSCAIRNVYDPIVDLDMVSEKGLYRVNDKNIQDGFNTRMTFVPDSLKSALVEYKLLRQKLLIHLRKSKVMNARNCRVSDNFSLFYLSVEGGKLKLNPFSRQKARDTFLLQLEEARFLGLKTPERNVVKILKHFRTNLNRHFIRGYFLDNDVPGYFIDAYLGHWHTGTQPWGDMSIFNQSVYLETVQRIIPKMLDELGFKTINECDEDE